MAWKVATTPCQNELEPKILGCFCHRHTRAKLLIARTNGTEREKSGNMTEDEAKTKWCPFTFAVPEIRGSDGCGIRESGPWTCSGPRCMAWFTENAATEGRRKGSDDEWEPWGWDPRSPGDPNTLKLYEFRDALPAGRCRLIAR